MAAGQRIKNLRRAIKGLGMDAFIITNLKNIRYLSGFSGSSGVALVTSRMAYLITDFRYRLQVEREVNGFQPVEQKGSREKFLGLFLRDLGVRCLGFETSSPHSFVRSLRRLARPASVKPADNLVEKLRLVKDAHEAAVIMRLVGMAREGFARFTAGLRAGVTEREAALELECILRRLGSDPPPFPLILASGENGAMPHASAGDRIIREGDPIIVDFGTAGEGYSTDITRTFCLGVPPPDIAKVYRVVYDAQKAAIETVRPGVRAAEVDASARSVIRAAGMGELFGHATGHGVGLDVHEAPGLSPESADVLRPGMVVTVEPGVYVEGRGGVRIEDMVLVTKLGQRVLTDGFPKPRTLGPPCHR